MAAITRPSPYDPTKTDRMLKTNAAQRILREVVVENGYVEPQGETESNPDFDDRTDLAVWEHLIDPAIEKAVYDHIVSKTRQALTKKRSDLEREEKQAAHTAGEAAIASIRATVEPPEPDPVDIPPEA